MTDGRIVYASQSSLYVTTENWASRPDPSTPTEAPPSVTTTIHKFDISDPTKTVYMGSGTVPGYLLEPVVALRVPGRAARRQHRRAGVVGEHRQRQRSRT